MLSVIYLKPLSQTMYSCVCVCVCDCSLVVIRVQLVFQCGLNVQEWSVCTLPRRPLPGLMQASVSASPSRSDVLPINSENVRNVSLVVKSAAC